MDRPKRQRKQIEPPALLVKAKKSKRSRKQPKKKQHSKPPSKEVTSLQIQVNKNSSATAKLKSATTAAPPIYIVFSGFF